MAIQITRDEVIEYSGLSLTPCVAKEKEVDGDTVTVYHYAKAGGKVRIKLSDGKVVAYVLTEKDDADLIWIGPELDERPTYKEYFQALNAQNAPSLNQLERAVMRRLHSKVGEDLDTKRRGQG